MIKEQRSRFIATLPYGVTIELIGVCEYPSEGKKWWKPDGTELSKEVSVRRRRGGVSASGIPYTVAVKVTMPEDATFEKGEIKGAKGAASLEAVDSKGRPISNMQAWMVYIDEKLTATSIQLGVATGAWKTRARNRSKGSVSTAGIVFSKAYESDGGVRIIVADEHLDLDYRITAIDTQDKEHLSQAQRSGSAGKVRQTTVLFSDIKLNQIKYFLFQTRPYQWVTFHNVSLKPGIKTDVQVERGKRQPTSILPKEVKQIEKVLNGWFGNCSTGNLEGAKKAWMPRKSNKAERDLRVMNELLALNSDWQFSLLAVMWDEADAMAVSAAFQNADPKVGSPMALVWRLKKTDEHWRITDIDLEELEGLQVENSRFMQERPNAQVWFDNPDFKAPKLRQKPGVAGRG